MRGVERPLSQLDVLADTLSLIEQGRSASPRLVEIRTEMMSHGVVPSEAIRRLKRLADMLDWRRNAFFATRRRRPSRGRFIWRRRSKHGGASSVRRSLHGCRRSAEYEALSSLGAYAYEHPDDPFPASSRTARRGSKARASDTRSCPPARMVRNDVSLTRQVRLLIVSGSNMSGKSTLLRTVGVNAVLAMAGAPVRAATLTLTPLAVGATLHVHDSLQAGRSRFFAEISRIRQIADLAGRQPAAGCFLLDELFQGTNSHDRRIGAEALLRSLIDRGAIGLTTTHDLALTAIADQSGGRAVNVHFEDRVEGWRAGVRLPDEAGTGDPQQCAGADESGGSACRHIDRSEI